MQKATVQGTTFDVEVLGETIKIDGKDFIADILPLQGNKFHTLMGNRSYNVEVIKFNPEEKKVILKINGKTLEVSLKDQLDLLLDKMGMSEQTSDKLKDLKAPMPGLILDVCVQEGQTVEKGDKLLVLEAMKMENVIKASGSGVVKKLKAQKGLSVEKNALLIEFE